MVRSLRNSCSCDLPVRSAFGNEGRHALLAGGQLGAGCRAPADPGKFTVRLLGPEPRTQLVKRCAGFAQRRPGVALLERSPANYAQDKPSSRALKLHLQSVLEIKRALDGSERVGNVSSGQADQRLAAGRSSQRRETPGRTRTLLEELEVLCCVVDPSKCD